jgi:hypothetical protein
VACGRKRVQVQARGRHLRLAQHEQSKEMVLVSKPAIRGLTVLLNPEFSDEDFDSSGLEFCYSLDDSEKLEILAALTLLGFRAAAKAVTAWDCPECGEPRGGTADGPNLCKGPECAKA